METPKELQCKAIKEMLIKKLKQLNYSGYKIKTELTNELGYEINYATLKNTLNLQSSALDIYCVIGLCRYLNLDIAYVLSPPDNPTDSLYYNESDFVSEHFSFLNDPKYMGVYY